MLDWSKIDTVLLDMDGTLLDLHFDNYFWHEHLPLCWAEQHKIPLAEAKEQLIPMFKKEEGTLKWYCLDFWSEKLQLDIMYLKQAVKHKIQLRPDTLHFLEFLKNTNKTIVMVTNAHPDLIDMKFVATNIGGYFHQVISSHILGVEKENTIFWQKLEREIAYQKHNTVLIDDNLKVLESAKNYGIEQLVSIVQPDSQVPAREIEGFLAIDLFEEIMP